MTVAERYDQSYSHSLEARVIPPLAQDPPTDDSPSQAWIRDWVDFLAEMLPLIIPVVVILVGILLIIRAKSGIAQVIVFGIGAAVVFMLLTNLESVADFFQNELPFEPPETGDLPLQPPATDQPE